jgi:hypothetical protein
MNSIKRFVYSVIGGLIISFLSTQIYLLNTLNSGFNAGKRQFGLPFSTYSYDLPKIQEWLWIILVNALFWSIIIYIVLIIISKIHLAIRWLLLVFVLLAVIGAAFWYVLNNYSLNPKKCIMYVGGFVGIRNECKQLSDCNWLNDDWEKSACYSNVAEYQKDESICDKTSLDYIKQSCHQYFQK